jgi:hypothetical protein
MAANVHVERYYSRYYWGRTSIVIPKKIFRLVSKPKRLPWIDSIPKIVDDEYFLSKQERSRSNERKAKSDGYKANLKKKIIIPYQLCPERERL